MTRPPALANPPPRSVDPPAIFHENPQFSRNQPSAPRMVGDGGAAIIEAALIFPLLISLLFGLIDFGYQYSVVLELRSSAREGARMASTNNGCSLSKTCPTAAKQLENLQAATRDRARGLADRDKIVMTVCYPNNPTPGVSNVTVNLSYPKKSITGMFSGMLVGNITATGVMRLEQKPTYDRSLGVTC